MQYMRHFQDFADEVFKDPQVRSSLHPSIFAAGNSIKGVAEGVEHSVFVSVFVVVVVVEGFG